MLCENSQVEVIREVSEAEMANTTSVCWRDAAKRDFNVLGKFQPGCNNPIQQYGLWDWLNGKQLWREECECPGRQQDSAVCSCSERIGFKNKAVASSYMYFPLLGTVRKYQKYLTVSGLCLALGRAIKMVRGWSTQHTGGDWQRCAYSTWRREGLRQLYCGQYLPDGWVHRRQR